MQEEINIPVFLAFEIMKRGLLPPFKLYIFLKCHSNGILKDNRNFVSSLSTHLKCSRNTIKEWLEILKSLNWIGFDPPNKIYYIRSFKSVCRIEDVRAKRGVIFYTSDFKKFKGFNVCIAVCSHKRFEY